MFGVRWSTMYKIKIVASAFVNRITQSTGQIQARPGATPGLGPGAWGLGPEAWGLGPGAYGLGLGLGASAREPGAWGLGLGA